MWLPKDERRLLTGYYRLLGDIDKERLYHDADLAPLLSMRPKLKLIPEYGKSALDRPDSAGMENMKAFKRDVKRTIAKMARVTKANRMLSTRKLVTIRPHQHVNDVILVALTLDGYDLGRRYAGWWERTGLWFERYREHWIWLIVAAVGGGLLPKFVEWLAHVLKVGR